MNNDNPVLRKAVRVAVGAAFIAPIVATQPSMAQVTGETYVTGTHIKRTDIEGPSPIISLDREVLEGSGFNTVADILHDLPAMGGNALNEGFTNSFAPGASGLDLRGLGGNATLVLLNGRRTSNYGFAQNITASFVDINSIPIAAVERIDILKDGASAIYGADAVAGVVNIILRKNFEGAEIGLGYGDTQDGGAEEGTFSLVAGKDFGKTNATFILDFFDRGMMYLTERDFSQTADQTANPATPEGFSFTSSFGNPGSAILLESTGDLVPDPACGVQPPSTFGPTGAPGTTGEVRGGRCRFDYSAFITAIPETRRAGFIMDLEHEFTPSMTGFLELGYQSNSTYQEAAPTPLVTASSFEFFGDYPVVPGSHPNNPYGEDVALFYRATDAGPRTQDISSDTSRFLAGLRGSASVYDWEVGLLYSQNKTDQDEENYLGGAQVQNALNNGTFNPFGGATNDPAVINSLKIDTWRKSKSELTMFDATITGPIGGWELGGGAVSFAAGYEYRDEKATDTPDPYTQANDVVASGGTSSDGSRTVNAVYGELATPFTDNIEMQWALRGEDSDVYGSHWDPKVGIRWQPTGGQLYRASVGTAYRAPSLVETNLGNTTSFVNASDTVRCDVTGADQDCGGAQYQQNFAGNPDLEPEEADFFNIGAVWQPTESVSGGIDYWYYKHDNLITNDTQAVLDNEGTNPEIVVRNPPTAQDNALGIPGEINHINDSFFNLAEQETYGLDFDAKYDAGNWDIGFLATRVLEFKRKATPDDEFEDVLGTRDGDVPYPEWKAVGFVNAEMGDWFGNIRLNYRDSYLDSTTDPDDNDVDIPSWTTVDLQVNYSGFRNQTWTVGGSNIFNEAPPFTYDEFEGYEVGIHNPRGAFWYLRFKYNMADLL
ncbi:MAG TPA: hypothetical protein DDW55_11220 [Gammaproteobacteria bacterium]|nr:hypothetical protein [Gammaproteobacteria bacterium]